MRTPRFWQHRGIASTLLQPAAWLYKLGACADRAHTTPQPAPLPVISIGNVTAGGAGKTPTALALAPLLHSMGHTPHFITRGYGSTGTGTRRVESSSPWQEVGDEALLLAATAPTWVNRDRLAAAESAKHAGASLVIADDALQHHKLHKNISLLVIDGAYGVGNGRLIPAGPLREPLDDALQRTDAVIMIGENRHGLVFDKPVFAARMQPVGDVAWLKDQPVLAFAGLARPEKFYASLETLGAKLVGRYNFPDHHPFTERELDTLCYAAAKAGAIPIATAKDAVKFPAAFRERIRVLPVELQFVNPPELQKWLQSALQRTI